MEPIPPPPPPPPAHLSHFVIVSTPFVAPAARLYLPHILHLAPPPPLAYPRQPPPAGIVYIPHANNRQQCPPSAHRDNIPPLHPGPSREPQPPPRYQIPRMPPPGRAATLSPAASTAEWETNTELPVLSSSSSSSSDSDTPPLSAAAGNSSSVVYDFDNEELAAQRAMTEEQADREEQERIRSLRDEPQRVARARSRPTSRPSARRNGDRRERKGRGVDRSHRRRPQRSTSRPASPNMEEGSTRPLKADLNWSAVGTVGSAGDGHDSDARDGSDEDVGESVKSIGSDEMRKLRRRFYGITGQKKKDEEEAMT